MGMILGSSWFDDEDYDESDLFMGMMIGSALKEDLKAEEELYGWDSKPIFGPSDDD